MGPYRQVFANSFSVALAFRWGLLVGVATQLLQTLGTIFVWRTILGGDARTEAFTADGMTTYFLAIALLSVMFSIGHFFRLSPLVARGTLSAYLVRPYSFLGDCAATFLGSSVAGLLTATVVAVGLWLAGVRVVGDVSWLGALLIAASLVLFFLFGSVVGLLSFWLVEMWPVQPLYAGLMALAGGTLFPLDALPPSLHRALLYTPFALFGFVPARALQGALRPDEAIRCLVAALVWSVVCLVAYRLLWHRGLWRFEAANA